MGKKAAAHISGVIKRICFIGFSIQIVLGIIWMGANFAHVQDFGKPESAFYGFLFRICGQCPQVLYVLQLAVAFAAGYFLLQVLAPAKIKFAIWRALVLLTFPFAMQTALAIQPYSLMGSLFLLCLALLLKKGGKCPLRYGAALACVLLFMILSGTFDGDNGDKVWDYGWEASFASRMGWSTILNDRGFWSEELVEYTEEVWWETTYCADNMVLLQQSVVEQAGEEKARDYFLEIARVGWQHRAPVVVRQVGWDVLGYAVTPLILPIQLAGEAYDSYTPGNYAAMREHTPGLCRVYMEYSCWWFGCFLCLAIVLSATRVGLLFSERDKKEVRKFAWSVLWKTGICVVASGVLVTLLTLRGAGVMDYRWTVGVNQLWLVWGMLMMRREGGEA